MAFQCQRRLGLWAAMVALNGHYASHLVPLISFWPKSVTNFLSKSKLIVSTTNHHSLKNNPRACCSKLTMSLGIEVLHFHIHCTKNTATFFGRTRPSEQWLMYTPRPVPLLNESKLLTQKFNANPINVYNSKSVTLTLGQQQYLIHCKLV